jgi:general secretion pathway protein I
MMNVAAIRPCEGHWGRAAGDATAESLIDDSAAGSATRRGDAGFTLLEALVAFVIAALALAVFYDGVVGGLRGTRRADATETALSLARSHLAALDATVLAPRVTEGLDGSGFRWRLSIKPAGAVPLGLANDADPVAGSAQAVLYAVSVTVSWSTGGDSRSVRLDSARVGANRASQ